MALSRDTLIEAVVIGATSGLFAGGVAVAARFAPQPTDVLGFVGGAFGAGAAVIGTLWVERRKESGAEQGRRDRIARMLVGLAFRADQVLTLPPERARSAMSVLRTTIGTFLGMRDKHVLDDPEAQAVLDTFAEQAEIARATLLTAETRLATGEMSDNDAQAELRGELSVLIRSVSAVFGYQAGWPDAAKGQAAAIAAPYW